MASVEIVVERKIIHYEIIENDDPIIKRKLLKERLNQRKLQAKFKGNIIGSYTIKHQQ